MFSEGATPFIFVTNTLGRISKTRERQEHEALDGSANVRRKGQDHETTKERIKKKITSFNDCAEIEPLYIAGKI